MMPGWTPCHLLSSLFSVAASLRGGSAESRSPVCKRLSISGNLEPPVNQVLSIIRRRDRDGEVLDLSPFLPRRGLEGQSSAQPEKSKLVARASGLDDFLSEERQPESSFPVTIARPLKSETAFFGSIRNSSSISRFSSQFLLLVVIQCTRVLSLPMDMINKQRRESLGSLT